MAPSRRGGTSAENAAKREGRESMNVRGIACTNAGAAPLASTGLALPAGTVSISPDLSAWAGASDARGWTREGPDSAKASAASPCTDRISVPPVVSVSASRLRIAPETPDGADSLTQPDSR